MDHKIDLKQYYVYIFWEEDIPLYVGVTRNIAKRFRVGNKSRLIQATQLQLIECQESDARKIEQETITKLRPLFNKQHNLEIAG